MHETVRREGHSNYHIHIRKQCSSLDPIGRTQTLREERTILGTTTRRWWFLICSHASPIPSLLMKVSWNRDLYNDNNYDIVYYYWCNVYIEYIIVLEDQLDHWLVNSAKPNSCSSSRTLILVKSTLKSTLGSAYLCRGRDSERIWIFSMLLVLNAFVPELV